jgi:hypothetical protein
MRPPADAARITRWRERSVQTFSVIRQAGMWTIIADGRRWGRFSYRVDAEEAALRLAAKGRALGRTVEVLSQDNWGEMHTLEAGRPQPAVGPSLS